MKDDRRERMFRWVRQPVLQFLAIGGLLFAAHAAVVEPEADPRVIEISAERLASLRAELGTRFGREPTPEELDAELERSIDQEVLFREALALGLDQGDPVLRRRLIQKMEFLVEEPALVAEPTDEDLDAWLAINRERFRQPAKVTFEHVFFARDRDGEPMERVAGEALRVLSEGGDAADIGDPFPSGRRFGGRSRAQLAESLGGEIADAVFATPLGPWSGPWQSRYGVHLVRVTERRAAEDARLEQVRDRVRGLWLEERRAAANEQAVARLRRRYDIRVAAPATGPQPRRAGP